MGSNIENRKARVRWQEDPERLGTHKRLLQLQDNVCTHIYYKNSGKNRTRNQGRCTRDLKGITSFSCRKIFQIYVPYSEDYYLMGTSLLSSC